MSLEAYRGIVWEIHLFPPLLPFPAFHLFKELKEQLQNPTETCKSIRWISKCFFAIGCENCLAMNWFRFSRSRLAENWKFPLFQRLVDPDDIGDCVGIDSILKDFQTQPSFGIWKLFRLNKSVGLCSFQGFVKDLSRIGVRWWWTGSIIK